MHHHFNHSWRHYSFDPLHSTRFHNFQFNRRMMYYRGPSRILWFAVGAFAATCYHRVNPPREFRGWGPCGNRRIEEWRAERAAMKEQSPPQATSQPKQNETAAEWSWKPNVSQSFEDEEIRRKWEEKTKEAQGKVRAFLVLTSFTF